MCYSRNNCGGGEEEEETITHRRFPRYRRRTVQKSTSCKQGEQKRFPPDQSPVKEDEEQEGVKRGG